MTYSLFKCKDCGKEFFHSTDYLNHCIADKHMSFSRVRTKMTYEVCICGNDLFYVAEKHDIQDDGTYAYRYHCYCSKCGDEL